MYFQIIEFPFILSIFLLSSATKCVDGDIEEDLQNLNTELTEIQRAITNAHRFGRQNELSNLKERLDDFRLRAYHKVHEYMVSGTEDDSIQRQINLYTHIDILYLPENIRAELEDLKELMHNNFINHFKVFEKEAFKSEISSSQRDIELQKQWIAFSECLGEDVEHVFNVYFNIINRVARNSEYNDPLSFWSYVTNEDQLPSIQEVKTLWYNELKQPYRQLLFLLQNDFSDIFTLHTEDSNTPGPLPAYLYDMIYNVYANRTIEKYEDTKLFQKAKKRDIVYSDPIRLKRMEVRSMTQRAASYFESLGFPPLDGFFWVQSEFKTTNNKSTTVIQSHYYSNTEYLIHATGPPTGVTFYRIHRTLYRIYRKLILDQTNHPTIFKELDFISFIAAFEAAVTMSAISHKRLLREGFMKLEEYTDEFQLEYLKGQAIKSFNAIASAMSMGTWKSDVLADKIPQNNRLCELWNRRYQYEGVKPTTVTSLPINTRLLLDVYSKNYVMGKELNFKHITGIILQYQIFARLCQLAGEYNPNDPLNPPLHLCDIQGSRTAGNLIQQVLREGSSKNWRQLLDIIFDTPNTPLSARGLLDYFAPIFVNAPKVPESLSENVWDEAVNFCES